MPQYTLYEAATGRITRMMAVPDHDLAANLSLDEQYICGWYSNLTHFVKDGVAVEKQQMLVSVSGHTISNLPIPCNANIEGIDYTITDGELTLAAAMPGPYTVRLSAVPYLSEDVVIP